MKKANVFLLTILLILCTLSNAYAYESLWDRIRDTEAQGETLLMGSTDYNSSLAENPIASLFDKSKDYRTDISFTVDNFEIHGQIDQSTQALIQLLKGITFSYGSQTGNVPRESLRIEIGGNELFTYDGQITTPYYVNSNFLGEKTYMVYPEDQFEEKVVASYYKMMAFLSGDTSELPDIEQVYLVIQTIREYGIETILASSSNAASSYNEDLDTSAFESVLVDFSSKFKESEPEKQNAYLYTDLPRWSRKYTWPEPTSLSPFTMPSSAVEADFTAADAEKLFYALDRFFDDNPNFKAMMNERIKAGLTESYPELAAMEGVDYIDMMLQDMKPSLMESLNAIVVNLKINMDENGEPVLTTVKISENNSNPYAKDSGIIITWHSIKGSEQTVIEAAVDFSDYNAIQPVFRLLSTSTHLGEGADTDTINFLLDLQPSSNIEYAQKTVHLLTSDKARVSDTDFQVALDKESGSGKIITAEIPSGFEKNNKTYNISYDHSSRGIPLFSLGTTLKINYSSPLPALTPSDAVAASQMDESDYDRIASNIVTQILMMTMSLY